MFKQKLILATFALATLCVACSDNNEVVETVEYPVEIAISFPEKDQDFRYEGWNENREVAALRTDNYSADKLVFSQSDGQSYTSTSELEITETTDFVFLYPSSASTVSGSDTLTQMLYIDKQEGTLDGLGRLDYTWGTYTYDTDEEDYAETCVMTPLMSFAKFRFTAEGHPLERISQVVITSPDDSLNVIGLLNMANGNVIIQRRGSMVVCNSQGMSGDVYAAFFPMKTSLHFTVSTLDGKTYEAALPEMMTFEAGQTYVHTDIACSALPPARIGDYYYSDGTWSAQLDDGRECIGIVFALDDSDGNLDRNLGESAHGRVVALQDSDTELAWCVTDFDVEGIDNQTVLQDTMYVGSLPYFDGTANGFFSDVATELLDKVRINEAGGQISNWYPDGALSDFDGQAHTAYILGISGTFNAVWSCRDYSEGMYGWYLPSEGELALLWALHRTGVICHDTHDVFTDFAQFGYWTSTEYDDYSAWYINFYSGMTTKNSKNSMYNIRPVIRF